MSEAFPEATTPDRRTNWKSVLTMLLVGLASLVLVSWLMNLFMVHVVYRLIVSTTGDMTGINLYLLKATAWAAIALLLYFKKGFKWLRGINSRLIWMFGILVAYNCWMYALTYNLMFRFSDGKPMKWAAVTNEGIKYYASPGFGPDGQQLIEVTPDTLKRLKSWDKPLARVDPVGVSWFNSNTGEPDIYYALTPGGDYEFFNRWGHHPQTGAELKPVSQNIKHSFEQRETEVATKTIAEEEEKKSRKLKALVNRIKMDPRKVNVVLALDASASSGGSTAETQAKLASSLRKISDRAAIHDDVLRPEFRQDGYFDKAFSGDVAFLKDTGIFDSANFLLLCRVKAESSANEALGGVFSCRTELTYRIFNQKGEQVDSGSIQAVGPGFSAQAALLRAIEIGIEKNGTELLRSVTPN